MQESTIKLMTETNTDECGNKEWYKNGKRHRDDDKPAVCEATTRQGAIVEWIDGTKLWYKRYAPNWKDVHTGNQNIKSKATNVDFVRDCI